MSTLYEELDGQIIVTLSMGMRVRCMPVGDLLMQVGAGIKDPPEPKIPTYTIIDAAGEVTQHEHSQTTIDDDRTDKETRQAWIEYQAAHTKWVAACAENESKRNDMKGKFIARRGIQVLDMPKNLVKWAKEQREIYGFDIPSDPIGLYLSYINNEVIRSREDGRLITLGIFKATGMDQEVLERIEDSFRSTMGKSNGTEAERDQEAS